LNRLLFAAVVMTAAAAVRAEEQGTMAGGGSKGVTHQVYASVAFEPASTSVIQNPSKATLTALIRISDHARESRFFGTVLATFVDVAVGAQVPEQKVWEDRVCHQDRGLPKVAVTALNAQIGNDQSQINISARPRHIGRLIPADEIVTRQALIRGTDQRGKFMLEEVTTRESHIRLSIKVYTVPCPL
jgi:hypothetical protein